MLEPILRPTTVYVPGATSTLKCPSAAECVRATSRPAASRTTMVAASGRGGHGELIRSTGQLGPDWTTPWIPLPDGAGDAAGVPQAASSTVTSSDASVRFIRGLVGYDAQGTEKFR